MMIPLPSRLAGVCRQRVPRLVCGMRPFSLVFALVAVVACVSATEPRNFHCFYVGDTVGVIEFHDPNHMTTACTFIVQKVTECSDRIDSRVLFHAKDCIVGQHG